MRGRGLTKDFIGPNMSPMVSRCSSRWRPLETSLRSRRLTRTASSVRRQGKSPVLTLPSIARDVKFRRTFHRNREVTMNCQWVWPHS